MNQPPPFKGSFEWEHPSSSQAFASPLPKFKRPSIYNHPWKSVPFKTYCALQRFHHPAPFPKPTKQTAVPKCLPSHATFPPPKPAAVAKQVTDKLMRLESASGSVQRRLEELEQQMRSVHSSIKLDSLPKGSKCLRGQVKTILDRFEGGKANGTDSKEHGDGSRPTK